VDRKRPDPNCPGCAELRARILILEKRIEALEAALAKAQKDSSTSSKPPSSDIVKPPRSGRKSRRKRRRGAQPGHPKHERTPFSPDQVTDSYDYTMDRCPDCGAKLEESDAAPRIIQQVEIIETPVRIEEHRGYAFWCPKCQKIHYAPFPAELKKAGLAGPRLTALIAYMKGVCHASFSTIRKFLRDVVGVRICRGQLRKLVNKASDSLEGAYTELLQLLRYEPTLNIDETGHKDNGDQFWTWCFRAQQYTFFKIDKSRGSDVLIEVLGQQFNGVLGCDYFSAYRKYMGDFGAAVQFCMAHLIRDVKFLTTLPDRVTRNYGNRLLDGLRQLFQVIHRRESMTEARFQAKLELARDAIIRIGKNAPQRNEAQNMAKRFREHGKAYFRFITTPGIEPTNNLAEQAMRFVVIDRRVTQGTRSAAGREWCERIWTAIATCTQQGRSVFEFLYDSITAHFAGLPGPSLLPADTS
jgi:transposase